jgi:Arc/MetJ-type ribon-helix-helix transcriptional regulator
MKKVLIYFPEELHEGMRELAFRRRTSVSELVRTAVETLYEDELDSIEGEKGLDEYLADPSASISVEEYMNKRFGAVRPKA